MSSMRLVEPKFVPPFEPGFRPAALANRAFRADTATQGVPLVIGLERGSGEFSRYETTVFPPGHPRLRVRVSGEKGTNVKFPGGCIRKGEKGGFSVSQDCIGSICIERTCGDFSIHSGAKQGMRKSCIRGRLEACPTRESELARDSEVTARMNHGTCVHVRSSGEVNHRKSAKKERESDESAN